MTGLTCRLLAIKIGIVAVTQSLARGHLLSLVGNAHVLVIIIATDEPYRAINNFISSQGDRGVFDHMRFILNPAGRVDRFGRLKRLLAREPCHVLLLHVHALLFLLVFG